MQPSSKPPAVLLHVARRVEAATQAAAAQHWVAHVCRKVLSRWLFFTQQRRLGLELLSSPSNTSCCSDGAATEHQWAAGHGTAHITAAAAAAAATGRAARRSLAAALGQEPRRGSTAAAPLHDSAGQHRSRHLPLHTPSPASPRQQRAGDEAPATPRSARSAASASLISMTNQLGGSLLSSPVAAAATAAAADGTDPGQRGSSFSFAGLCSGGAANGSRSSVFAPGALLDAAAAAHRRVGALVSPPRSSRQMAGAWACSGPAHAGAAGAGASAGLAVPTALAASFAALARAQRLRRRWLLRKALNRWVECTLGAGV
jgi:hypothetical protein